MRKSQKLVLAQSSGETGLAIILIASVCAVVFVTHWSALSAKALSIDDQMYLTKNVLVQNPGWASAKRFLTEVLKPSTVKGYYQPLTMISLMLDYATGGREDNLRPFHITSLLLHTANTALIIVLLYMLFGNIWAASAAGLLFGVHPMTVEPIPWVSERKTLLAAFFALWSLVLYVRYSRSGGWKAYAGCFVMYLLALMSKPTSLPLPVVMLLMDYWPLKRLKVKTFLEKLPLFAAGGISALITYISQYQTAGVVSAAKSGSAHILLVICHNIIFYLYKIILPINLTSYYAFPKSFGLSHPMVLAGVIGTCILIPVLLISLCWTRSALTGWLIFFVMILPTMQVIGFSDYIASDKFAYLPSVGLLMIVVSFLLWVGKNKKVTTAAAVVVLALASAETVATQRYLVYWRDSITLINHMLALAPDSSQLYDGRGNIYFENGAYNLAISDFDKALEINPMYDKSYCNRGIAYYRKGDLGHAISDFNKAIETNPGRADAYGSRGSTYAARGDFDRAISDYNKAIEINPGSAEVYYNRGVVYARSKGQLDLAISDYNKAIEINPKYYQAYFNKAIACKNAGRKKEAVETYKAFIKCAPAQYAQYIEVAKQRIRELEQ